MQLAAIIDWFRACETDPIDTFRVESLFWRRSTPSEIDPEGELADAAAEDRAATLDADALATAWASAREVSLWSTEAEARAAALAELDREAQALRAELGQSASALVVDRDRMRLAFVVGDGCDAVTLWWLRVRVAPAPVIAEALV